MASVMKSIVRDGRLNNQSGRTGILTAASTHISTYMYIHSATETTTDSDFFSFYMYRPSFYGLWLPDIKKD